MNEIIHADESYQSSDEGQRCNCPIFDTFYDGGGSLAITFICNFTASELDELRMMLTDHVSTTWSVGRGPKTTITGKDIIFI